MRGVKAQRVLPSACHSVCLLPSAFCSRGSFSPREQECGHVPRRRPRVFPGASLALQRAGGAPGISMRARDGAKQSREVISVQAVSGQKGNVFEEKFIYSFSQVPHPHRTRSNSGWNPCSHCALGGRLRAH